MIVVLNNKSNINKKEFMEYQNELKKIESSYQLVICPSQVYLNSIDLPTFDLGSQNVSSYHQGAYTGEIYAHQLKSLDVKYCLVGHSERRKYQRETNKDIKRIKNKIPLVKNGWWGWEENFLYHEKNIISPKIKPL